MMNTMSAQTAEKYEIKDRRADSGPLQRDGDGYCELCETPLDHEGPLERRLAKGWVKIAKKIRDVALEIVKQRFSYGEASRKKRGYIPFACKCFVDNCSITYRSAFVTKKMNLLFICHRRDGKVFSVQWDPFRILRFDYGDWMSTFVKEGDMRWTKSTALQIQVKLFNVTMPKNSERSRDKIVVENFGNDDSIKISSRSWIRGGLPKKFVLGMLDTLKEDIEKDPHWNTTEKLVK